MCWGDKKVVEGWAKNKNKSHGHKQQFGDCGRWMEGTEEINGGGKLNEEKMFKKGKLRAITWY